MKPTLKIHVLNVLEEEYVVNPKISPTRAKVVQDLKEAGAISQKMTNAEKTRLHKAIDDLSNDGAINLIKNGGSTNSTRLALDNDTKKEIKKNAAASSPVKKPAKKSVKKPAKKSAKKGKPGKAPKSACRYILFSCFFVCCLCIIFQTNLSRSIQRTLSHNIDINITSLSI